MNLRDRYIFLRFRQYLCSGILKSNYIGIYHPPNIDTNLEIEHSSIHGPLAGIPSGILAASKMLNISCSRAATEIGVNNRFAVIYANLEIELCSIHGPLAGIPSGDLSSSFDAMIPLKEERNYLQNS